MALRDSDNDVERFSPQKRPDRPRRGRERPSPLIAIGILILVLLYGYGFLAPLLAGLRLLCHALR